MSVPLTDIVLRLSGTVDFTDGTTQIFLATWEDGQLIQPFSSTSLSGFQQLWNDDNVPLKSLLSSLGGHYTISPSAPSPNLTVKDWTFLFDGHISRSDGSSDCFSAVYDAAGGPRVVNPSIYEEVLLDDSQWLSAVNSVFASVAGTAVVKA